MSLEERRPGGIISKLKNWGGDTSKEEHKITTNTKALLSTWPISYTGVLIFTWLLRWHELFPPRSFTTADSPIPLWWVALTFLVSVHAKAPRTQLLELFFASSWSLGDCIRCYVLSYRNTPNPTISLCWSPVPGGHWPSLMWLQFSFLLLWQSPPTHSSQKGSLKNTQVGKVVPALKISSGSCPQSLGMKSKVPQWPHSSLHTDRILRHPCPSLSSHPFLLTETTDLLLPWPLLLLFQWPQGSSPQAPFSVISHNADKLSQSTQL